MWTAPGTARSVVGVPNPHTARAAYIDSGRSVRAHADQRNPLAGFQGFPSGFLTLARSDNLPL